MSLSDPIGDMIARIKNSQARKHKSVKLPSSKFKIKIAEVLKDEGFIIDFKTIGKDFNYSIVEFDEKKCPYDENNLIDQIKTVSQEEKHRETQIEKDKNKLNSMWQVNNAPWKIWK